MSALVFFAALSDEIGSSGFADCDHSYSNGCEVSIVTDAQNCGSCGAKCSQSGAAWPQVTDWGCDTGKCTIAACANGYFNCDGVTTNGCESLIPCCSVASNCTSRNWAQVASYTCLNSLCGIGSCNANYADCDGNPLDGCEANLRTTSNECGSCSTDCNNPGAPQTSLAYCTNSLCAIQTCAVHTILCSCC
jgi:hypothetical protein